MAQERHPECSPDVLAPGPAGCVPAFEDCTQREDCSMSDWPWYLFAVKELWKPFFLGFGIGAIGIVVSLVVLRLLA
jgi:hypothetical protein